MAASSMFEYKRHRLLKSVCAAVGSDIPGELFESVRKHRSGKGKGTFIGSLEIPSLRSLVAYIIPRPQIRGFWAHIFEEIPSKRRSG